MNSAARLIAWAQILALLVSALWLHPVPAQADTILGSSFAICSAHGASPTGEPSGADGKHTHHDCCLACHRTLHTPPVFPDFVRVAFAFDRISCTPALADDLAIMPAAQKPFSARSPPAPS